MRPALVIACILLAGCAAPPVPPAEERAAATWEEGTVDGGGLASRYLLRIPAGDGATERPLIVMLHGGGGTPEEMIEDVRMDEAADAAGVLLVFPEAPTPLGSPPRAWRWWDRAHQERDTGEPALLVALVAAVDSRAGVDAARVFAGGFSAGGFMSGILAATYPDVFSAVAIHSGGEYRAADSELDVPKVMLAGGPDPATQARLAKDAMGGAARPVRVLVFHGDADRSLAPVNGEQAFEQWGATNALLGLSPDEAIREGTEDGLDYVVVCRGTALERWTVAGLDHAWSGSPSRGMIDRGTTYGPSASRETLRFFLEGPGGCDHA